jgi:hypothetical protein
MCYNLLMRISLKNYAGENIVVLDAEWSEIRGDKCETCKRTTPTITIEGSQTYAKVEICPDCLIKALSVTAPAS